MGNFEDFEKKWKSGTNEIVPAISETQLREITRNRVKAQVNKAMQFFWKSLIYQIIVYAVLFHVALRYHSFGQVVIMCLVTIAAFIPFTVLLLRQFKRLAVIQVPANGTMADSVKQKENILNSFYRFKKYYEYFLIPVSSFAVTFGFFELYFPGGVRAFSGLFISSFLVALASCFYAIYRENRINFQKPLAELRAILDELKS